MENGKTKLSLLVGFGVSGLFITVLGVWTFFHPTTEGHPSPQQVVKLPPALGQTSHNRTPASAAADNNSNCKVESANSCFQVVRCSVAGGSTASYIDPKTDHVFALISNNLQYRSPGRLLGDFEGEFNVQQTQNKRARLQDTQSSPRSRKHRESTNTEHLSASVTRFGRRVKSVYVLSQQVPACVQQGDLQ